MIFFLHEKKQFITDKYMYLRTENIFGCYGNKSLVYVLFISEKLFNYLRVECMMKRGKSDIENQTFTTFCFLYIC